MSVNKTFSTCSNFGLFMCTFTDDCLTTCFIFNPPKLGNKQNMLSKLHLETGNGKTSINTLEKKKVLEKKKLAKKVL